MALASGQVLDNKYRIVRLIGEGGMGTVYEGENTRIGRRVAIKVLHLQVASMPEFVERFEREARAAARIGSPHVCDVLDLGDLPSGDRYIVMEFLDGVSFEDRLEDKKKLTPSQLAPIAFELLEGLGTMHGARVIHRDLKPANVFLSKINTGRGEVVKILDFGVAKLLPMAGEVGTMTQTGMMMGTPLYMSPEQARGAKDVDGRTDLYAASVMFYRALTGELPYSADTLNELLFKIVLEDPKPIRELAPEIDEVFAEIIHKGLARELDKRFATAREFQMEIAAWGKTQGRSSLSFAVTVRSEPPPALPPGSAAPVTGAARPATPVGATSANGGTPTAWSEDGPEAAGGSTASASSTSGISGVGNAAPPTPIRSAVTAEPAFAATAVVPSEPRGPWVEGPGLADSNPNSAQATTGPSATAPRFPPTAAKGSSRGPLAMGGGVAAIAVLGLVGFFAFGRNSAGTGTNGTSASTSSSATAATTPSTGEPPPPTSAAATATPSPLASGDPPASDSTPSATTAVPAVPAARRDPGAGSGRKPTTMQTTPSATASAPVPPSATAAVTAAPSAKPAASSRKFRTNLD